MKLMTCLFNTCATLQDLFRTNLTRAMAVFVMCNKFAQDVEQEDEQMLMTVLALSQYIRQVCVCVCCVCGCVCAVSFCSCTASILHALSTPLPLLLCEAHTLRFVHLPYFIWLPCFLCFNTSTCSEANACKL